MTNELIKRLISSIILLPSAFFFIYKGSNYFIFFLAIAFACSCYEWIKMNKNFNFSIIFGIFLLTFSFLSAYQLRNDFGFYSFLFVILICIFTDIGGYIFGKIFKGPKLNKLSPGKTYSGVVGSFVVSLIGSLIYLNYKIDSFNIIKHQLSQNTIQNLNEYNLIMFLIILTLSTISQLGDLTISYFKRRAKIKDTGKILPGHGGLLDRIDGMIFAIPFLYIILFSGILNKY